MTAPPTRAGRSGVLTNIGACARLAALFIPRANHRLGTRPGPLPTWGTAIAVTAVAITAVLLAALRPAWQAVRRTTLGSLAAPLHTPAVSC